MNWKAEAMEKLRRYDAMRQSVHNIPKEIERLEIAAVSLRGANTATAPVKGGGSKKEELLMNNLVHRQELEWLLGQAKCWLDTTERALSALSPEEKLILHRMYICPEKSALERLCGELNVEKSSIYRKRDKALYRFAVALYGFPEQGTLLQC